MYGRLRTYHPGPIEHLLPSIKQSGRSAGDDPRVGRQLFEPGNVAGKRMLGPSDDGEPIIEEWFLKKVRPGVITKRADKDIDLAAAKEFDQFEVRPFQNVDRYTRLLAQ